MAQQNPVGGPAALTGNNIEPSDLHRVPIVTPDENQAGIEQAITDADPGDHIIVSEGVYDLDKSQIQWSKELHFETLGTAVLKHPDNLFAADDHGLDSHTFEALPGAEGSTLEGFIIDHNVANQPASEWTFGVDGEKPPYCHAVRLGGAQNNEVVNVTVKNCVFRNLIRSGVSGKMRQCTIRNLWTHNSAFDHHVYLAGAINTTARDLTMTGYSRNAFLVGGTGNKTTRGALVNEWVIGDVAANPYDNNPDPCVIIRNEGVTDGWGLKNGRIDTTDVTAFGARVLLNQPDGRVDGLDITTHAEQANIVEVAGNNIELVDYRLRVPSANPNNQMAALELLADGLVVRDSKWTEDSGESRIRGIYAPNAQADITIDNLTVDIGRHWYHADSEQSRVRLASFTETRSNGIKEDAPIGLMEEGTASESAAAEQPQKTYSPGVVDFTDTGDGSGTGSYLVHADGSTTLIA